MWVHQDGATCHTPRANMALSGLRNFSSWRYQLTTQIMRFDTIRLFLVGYAKDRVYADQHSTLEHIKTNIRQVMAEIEQYVSKRGRKFKESMLATLRVEVI